MILTMLLPPSVDKQKWTLARQMGVSHAITKATTELTGEKPPYDFTTLQHIKNTFEKAGFQLYGLEGDQFDMSSIKLGLSDRDEWIEKYKMMLHNMGRLDIPLICMNWMAVFGWFRSRVDIPERGNAMTSGFNIDDVKDCSLHDRFDITEKQLWYNLYYFLDAVLPVAEANKVKIALHPDDPPINPLKGVPRILTSAWSYDEIFKQYPSESLGVTFCQATFKTMNEDIKRISEKWIKERKVFFIHIRDITGNKNHFRETFIDTGDTSIPDMLEHYHSCGFDGPIRSDHAPAMYGEYKNKFSGGISNGYETLGHLYATGYMKGICDSKHIPLV